MTFLPSPRKDGSAVTAAGAPEPDFRSLPSGKIGNEVRPFHPAQSVQAAPRPERRQNRGNAVAGGKQPTLKLAGSEPAS